MLDNGYVYPADVRLTAYSDDMRRAIVLEQLGHSPRGGGHRGITDALHVFGNCITGEAGMTNDGFLIRTDDPPGEEIFEDYDVIRPAGTIMVRETPIRFDVSPSALERKGIVPAEERAITAIDLIRSLLPEHRDQFLATDVEKRARIPEDLPEFLRLEEWYHPDICNDELPSQTKTFQMLAAALVYGDSMLYSPAEKPNTHWTNWPMGGSL